MTVLPLVFDAPRRTKPPRHLADLTREEARAAVTELGENGQIANAIRDSSGQTIGRAGDRIVEKQLSVKPTVTVRPGARVRVLVSRDLVLEPWRTAP